MQLHLQIRLHVRLRVHLHLHFITFHYISLALLPRSSWIANRCFVKLNLAVTLRCQWKEFGVLDLAPAVTSKE